MTKKLVNRDIKRIVSLIFVDADEKLLKRQMKNVALTVVRRMAFAAIAAIVVHSAFAADETELVPKPEVKVGDSWTYRDMNYWNNTQTRVLRMTVTLVKSDVVLVGFKYNNDTSERDSQWTSEWNAVSAPAGQIYSPHWGLFKFPLAVGAKYETVFDLTARSGGYLGQWKHEQTVTVVGWEDIEVPAGKFRALKVVSNGVYARQDYSYTGRVKRTAWYVPHVKRWVKYTYEDTDGSGRAAARLAPFHQRLEIHNCDIKSTNLFSRR